MNLNFEEQIQLVFEDGAKSGTHKYAFIRSILDYAIEAPLEETLSKKSDLQIPLTYIAVKHIEYYWRMFVLGQKKEILQSTRGNISYYKDIFKIATEVTKNEKFEEGDLFKILETIYGKEIPKKVLSGINGLRKNIFVNPVKFCKNIQFEGKKQQFNFYEASEEYNQTKGLKYFDLIKNETIYITIPFKHLDNLIYSKRLLLYATKLHWGLFTDQYNKIDKSGISYLEDLSPDRSSLEKYLRIYKSELQVKKCVYCNQNNATAIDHIYPRSLCHRDDFWNMIPACQSCNSKKSNKVEKITSKNLDILKNFIDHILKNHLEKYQIQLNYRSAIDGIEFEPMSSDEISEYLVKYIVGKVGLQGVELEV